MKGTLVNAACVIVGGLLGLVFKKGIKESYQQSVNKALGTAVLVIGINGVIASMFSVSNGVITSSGELVLVISLVVGTLIGEMIGIDSKLEKFSTSIEKKFEKDNFAQGFMNATVLFCVGAMSVVGALNDGLSGDATTLYVKSALDFTSAIILSSTMGFGVIFSFIPLFIYQGAISLFASVLQNVLHGIVLDRVCFVGYAIIICIGLNFLLRDKIKTANMLPALLVAVIYSAVESLVASL